MIPKEARQLWADTLRSGKYKQGQAFLCRNGNYCCLGVACEIYSSCGKKVSGNLAELQKADDSLNPSLEESCGNCQWTLENRKEQSK